MNLTPSLKRILASLSDCDMDAEELAASAHVTKGTLKHKRYMPSLISAGLVRIAAWERSADGPPKPIYSVSPGKNKRKPVPFTNSQKCKRWRERVGYATERSTVSNVNALIWITARRAKNDGVQLDQAA